MIFCDILLIGIRNEVRRRQAKNFGDSESSKILIFVIPCVYTRRM